MSGIFCLFFAADWFGVGWMDGWRMLLDRIAFEEYSRCYIRNNLIRIRRRWDTASTVALSMRMAQLI